MPLASRASDTPLHIGIVSLCRAVKAYERHQAVCSLSLAIGHWYKWNIASQDVARQRRYQVVQKKQEEALKEQLHAERTRHKKELQDLQYAAQHLKDDQAIQLMQAKTAVKTMQRVAKEKEDELQLRSKNLDRIVRGQSPERSPSKSKDAKARNQADQEAEKRLKLAKQQVLGMEKELARLRQEEVTRHHVAEITNCFVGIKQCFVTSINQEYTKQRTNELSGAAPGERWVESRQLLEEKMSLLDSHLSQPMWKFKKSSSSTPTPKQEAAGDEPDPFSEVRMLKIELRHIFRDVEASHSSSLMMDHTPLSLIVRADTAVGRFLSYLSHHISMTRPSVGPLVSSMLRSSCKDIAPTFAFSENPSAKLWHALGLMKRVAEASILGPSVVIPLPHHKNSDRGEGLEDALSFGVDDAREMSSLLHSLTFRIDELESENETLREHGAFMKTSMTDAEGEVSILQTRLKRAEEDLQLERASTREVSKAHLDLKEKVARLESDNKQLSTNVESLKASLDAGERKNDNYQAELMKLAGGHQALIAKYQQCQDRIAMLETLKENQQSSIVELEKSLGEADASMAATRQSLRLSEAAQAAAVQASAETSSEVNDLRHEVESLRQQVVRITDAKYQLESEYELLKRSTDQEIADVREQNESLKSSHSNGERRVRELQQLIDHQVYHFSSGPNFEDTSEKEKLVGSEEMGNGITTGNGSEEDDIPWGSPFPVWRRPSQASNSGGQNRDGEYGHLL